MAEKYTVLARRYRPQNFDQIIGQEAIVMTLRNILLAKKIGSAYLFCGQRGVGKTTSARIFANAINCENLLPDGNPCQKCKACLEYKNVFELDAASNNSVEDVRNIIDQVRYAPTFGKYSIFIIDEVHMLSQAAFNAFLKTLEEPPAHAIFILATTEKNKVPLTIMSRCQLFNFLPVSIPNIVHNLKNILDKEKISYEEQALFSIAEKADGAMRDALSFTDAILNFSPDKISLEASNKILNIIDQDLLLDLVKCIASQDTFHLMLKFNEILNGGHDLINLATGLLKFFRTLVLVKSNITKKLCEISEETMEKLENFGQGFTAEDLLECIKAINEWSLGYKDQINKKFYFEFLLLKLQGLLQKGKEAPREFTTPKKEEKTLKTFDLNKIQTEKKADAKGSLLESLEAELNLTEL